MSTDAKQCPHCGRWCLKDNACAYIFSDGLDEHGKFLIGQGCGRSFCWRCGLKYCGHYTDAATGRKMRTARDVHDAACCVADPDFCPRTFCAGGHSAHCAPRTWPADVAAAHAACTPALCAVTRRATPPTE